MADKIERLNAFINNSATIVENAGEDIAEPEHKAVMYDGDGNVVIADSGEKAIGVVLSCTLPLEKGMPVHILIKQIGLLEMGEEIKKGDLVTISDDGRGYYAEPGDFIFGRAFTPTSTGGELAQVQINPMGYMNAEEDD